MEDLLKHQIQDSCRLALPEGLRDLMCDISREVLRAQPVDLYKFITDYLAALLLVRDTLPISCQVCNDVCNSSCELLLDEELRNIGLYGDDLETAKNVVVDHFEKGEASEGNLLMKLFRKTNIDTNLLPDIQEAVRTAFIRRQRQLRVKLMKADPDSIFKTEGEKAAQRMLRFHEKSYDDHEGLKNEAATKIQACYRGYFTRRSLKERLKPTYNEETATSSKVHKELPKPIASKPKSHAGRLSSTSLAGSYINLPKYVPYSVYDTAYAEYNEKEHSTIDYTLSSHFRDISDEGKRIVFHDSTLHEVDSSVEEEETERYIEEDIVEVDKSEASSVDESIITISRPFMDIPVKENSLDDEINDVDVENNLLMKIIVEEVSGGNGTENESPLVYRTVQEEHILVPNYVDDEIETHAIIENDDECEETKETLSNREIENVKYEDFFDDKTKPQDFSGEGSKKRVSYEYVSELFIPIKPEVQNKSSPKKLSIVTEDMNEIFERRMTKEDVLPNRVSVDVHLKRTSNTP